MTPKNLSQVNNLINEIVVDEKRDVILKYVDKLLKRIYMIDNHLYSEIGLQMCDSSFGYKFERYCIKRGQLFAKRSAYTNVISDLLNYCNNF